MPDEISSQLFTHGVKIRKIIFVNCKNLSSTPFDAFARRRDDKNQRGWDVA